MYCMYPFSDKHVLGHPCENDKQESIKCCHFWTKNMDNNLEAMMKIMRFAKRRGNPGFDLYSLITNGTTNILQYSLEDEVMKKQSSRKFDVASIVPICFFQDMDEDSFDKRKYSLNSCQYFQPAITDKGMCQAFNLLPVVDIIKPSYFTESFYNAYENDLILDRVIHNGTESGDSFNFHLLGNFRTRFTQGVVDKEMVPSKFMLGISNTNEYFDLQKSRKIIPAGYKLTISIQAMEIVPSNGMKDVSIESRNCRLPDENQDLKIFKIYSKPACEFEFRLFEAQEICNCVPWNIPWHSIRRYPICDIYGNYCFKSVWKNNQKGTKGCLPGCHQLKFTSSEIREKLDAEVLCKNVSPFSTGIKRLAAILWNNSGMTLFTKIKRLKELSTIRNWNDATYNETEERVKFCKSLVENDLAEVTVIFERPEFIRTSTSKRTSFPDQLGVFGNNCRILNYEIGIKNVILGGTLGLFTGMSILSMVEILYWLLKFAFKLFEGCGSRMITNPQHTIYSNLTLK